MTRPVAVVDVGTNSTRLLVTDGHHDLERIETVTRLGRGVDASRRLAAESIDRTCETLRRYGEIWSRHDVAAVRVIATSAARDALNRDEFFDQAEHATGVRPTLLSGQQEAAYSFAGATSGLDPDDAPWLVIDVGGGSTEFILGGPQGPSGSLSVDVGSVRLTERYFAHDPPRPDELANAIGDVRDWLSDVELAIDGVVYAKQLVGVAGTITTIAAVELGLDVYDRSKVHHARLARDAVEDVFRTLATERLADRVHNPGLASERADVIVGGCCVVVTVMRWLGATELLVSETDLLDGIAAELLGSQAPR